MSSRIRTGEGKVTKSVVEQNYAVFNQPNNAAIHGLEESTGVHALAMEVVEGETLAERISRGSIPMDEEVLGGEASGEQVAPRAMSSHQSTIRYL